jgi:hypothetical protein
MKDVLFIAKDIKTGEYRIGDLAHVYTKIYNNDIRLKYYILKHAATGGNIYITTRYLVDPSTIEIYDESINKQEE